MRKHFLQFERAYDSADPEPDPSRLLTTNTINIFLEAANAERRGYEAAYARVFDGYEADNRQEYIEQRIGMLVANETFFWLSPVDTSADRAQPQLSRAEYYNNGQHVGHLHANDTIPDQELYAVYKKNVLVLGAVSLTAAVACLEGDSMDTSEI